MLAQLDTNILIVAVSGCYIAILGVVYWSSSHINDSQKHPSSDNIVYRDVCAQVQKQQEERYETLLREIKTTQTLIRNNGYDKPNVIT